MEEIYDIYVEIKLLKKPVHVFFVGVFFQFFVFNQDMVILSKLFLNVCICSTFRFACII